MAIDENTLITVQANWRAESPYLVALSVTTKDLTTDSLLTMQVSHFYTDDPLIVFAPEYEERLAEVLGQIGEQLPLPF